ACVLDLATERAALQRRKDQLVVAPDEFVRPAFELTTARVEEILLSNRTCRADRTNFFSWFVDVFQCLKRKNCGRDFACLAVPDEFNFTLVFKKEEAIFLRQRFALVDELDEVALLGVGEFVLFCVVLASHWQS